MVCANRLFFFTLTFQVVFVAGFLLLWAGCFCGFRGFVLLQWLVGSDSMALCWTELLHRGAIRLRRMNPSDVHASPGQSGAGGSTGWEHSGGKSGLCSERDFFRTHFLAMRKASGYFLLVYSCLAYGMIAALPFFEISVGEAAAFITGLIISCEAAFLLGVALLGKEALAKIKAVFRKKQ